MSAAEHVSKRRWRTGWRILALRLGGRETLSMIRFRDS